MRWIMRRSAYNVQVVVLGLRGISTGLTKNRRDTADKVISGSSRCCMRSIARDRTGKTDVIAPGFCSKRDRCGS
jgi:hypothetical protein